MKAYALSIAVLLVVSTAGIVSAADTQTMPHVYAEIVYCQGEDIVVLSSGRQKALSDPIGERLSAGDQIQTGSKTIVELVLMPRKSRLRLSENTIATIRELSSQGTTGIELIYGRLRSKVARAVDRNESFNVRTSSVVAAVRGTDFGCDVVLAPTGQMAPIKVYCFEGSVDVSAVADASETKPVTIEAGTMALVSLSAAKDVFSISTTTIDADTQGFWKMNEFSEAMPSADVITQADSLPEPSGRLAESTIPDIDFGPIRKGIAAKNSAIVGSAALFIVGAALGGTAFYLRSSEPELADRLLISGALTASLALPSLILAVSIDPLKGIDTQ